MKTLRDFYTPKHERLLGRVNDPTFSLVSWTGTNIDDAFEFGRMVGYAEAAKEVHDALAGSEGGGSVEATEHPARPGSAGLAGYRR